MSSNTNIQVSELDFNDIKSNFITYLQGQNTFKDYNFTGSGLSILLDVLAYNTQYNAYYLNMVANEMFLDTALIRGSVVSHAKLLNYTPRSAIAPTANVNILVNQVTTPTLTLPKNTILLSEAVNGVNYRFVTTQEKTVNVTANNATFSNISIKQGEIVNLTYTVDLTSNPTLTFNIPDQNVDTSTLLVQVQESSSNTNINTYNLASDYLSLNSGTKVYFLQESINGVYEIYFGDGILGKKLVNNNLVKISYLVTNGTGSSGANSFVLMNSVSGFSNTVVSSVFAATNGSEKESIDSIKYTAPKQYSAQGRAVTKDDYITLIQDNNLGYSFDAVNVWGGQENDPPAYGQLFISIKPAGAYTLTPSQKQQIVTSVIKPISVLTVQPTLVDPDYTYLQITTDVVYDPKKTTLTGDEIKTKVINAINSFATNTLNTFNSTFVLPDLISQIQSADSSVVTNETVVKLQKKFYPILNSSTSYTLRYGVPLQRNYFTSGVRSSPAIQYRDANADNVVRDGVYIEEVPTFTAGIASISVSNPGFGYTAAPTVTIFGDGTGATAHSVITNGRVTSIIVDTPGINYTQATVVITNASDDTTGVLAAGVTTVGGSIGTLRTYYYNNNTKIILNETAGTIDYTNGIVTLVDFSPFAVNNDLGQLAITASPTTSIFSSSYNRIITVDPFDSGAITVNITAKT